MQVTEIVASKTVKCNTGDYESTDQFISMKADVTEDDDVHEARKQLNHLVEKSMVTILLGHYKARGKKVDADYIIRRHGLGKAREA